MNEPPEIFMSPLISSTEAVEVNEAPESDSDPTEMSAVPPTNVPPPKVAELLIVIVLMPCVIVPVNPLLTVNAAALRLEPKAQLASLVPSKTTASSNVGTPALPGPPGASDQFADRFE